MIVSNPYLTLHNNVQQILYSQSQSAVLFLSLLYVVL